MRIESDDNSSSVFVLGVFRRGGDHRLVAKMHAVEVTNGNQSRRAASGERSSAVDPTWLATGVYNQRTHDRILRDADRRISTRDRDVPAIDLGTVDGLAVRP